MLFFFACADKRANYDVKVSKIDITPYPVKGGKTTTFSIIADTGNKLHACSLFFFSCFIIFM